MRADRALWMLNQGVGSPMGVKGWGEVGEGIRARGGGHGTGRAVWVLGGMPWMLGGPYAVPSQLSVHLAGWRWRSRAGRRHQCWSQRRVRQGWPQGVLWELGAGAELSHGRSTSGVSSSSSWKTWTRC